MEIIKIERTSTTPSVLFDFDNNRYEIKGCSRPEDVVAFYGQLIDWLTDIKRNINDDVLLINKLFESGLQVAIEWQYKKEDEDMLETGKEFTDLIKCPINFVAF